MLGVLTLLVIGAALLTGPALVLGDQDHVSTVAAMRDGSNYYALISGIVPSGAFAGRLVPLPTLAVVQSAAGMLGTTILLCAILASILLIGFERLGELFVDVRGRAIGMLLLLAGVAAAAFLAIIEPQAGWSALLAGWSLLLRRRSRWIEAAALGAAAMTIDPAALVVVIVMVSIALRDHEAREAVAWLLAAALGIVTFLIHRSALSRLGIGEVGIGPAVPPIDVVAAALLPGLPAWLGAATWMLALIGWCVTRSALAERVAAITVAGTLLAFVPGMPSAATLTIAVLPLGLVFAVDGVASLIRQATSRRRITITRVAR